MCGVQFVVMRGFYPVLWDDARNFTDTARQELLPVHKQLNRVELFAVLIPLVAAIVFLMFGELKTDDAFRVIATSLIVLGILGFHFTSAVTNHLSRVIVALTNTKD